MNDTKLEEMSGTKEENIKNSKLMSMKQTVRTKVKCIRLSH
jgi:hypothetical protein